LEEIQEGYQDWMKTVENPADYFVYLGYHVTNAPMTWDECQSIHIAKTLGIPVSANIYHRHSDLTGYLWTTIDIKDGNGHDVYREIKEVSELYIADERYLTLRFEIRPKG
jgi:hypothetical protein